MTDLANLSITADSSDLKAAAADMRAVEPQGKRTERAARKTGQAISQSAATARQSGAGYKVAGGHVANLTSQFNDIGVMMASGQSPLLLAAQQGTQITQVFQQMNTSGKGTLRALGSAFASMVSPVNLVTLGVIDGGAALVQWGTQAVRSGRETRELSEIVDELESALQTSREATEALQGDNRELAESYGAAPSRGFAAVWWNKGLKRH